jgi:long-chain acyl-CoA synthetase
MMKPIWLKNYPKGVPAEVNVDEYRSLCELFDASAHKFAALPAFVNMGTAITYREIDRLSRRFGAYLRYVLKLPKGARVALMMPNLLQYPVAMFGTLRAGYTVVNCNPLYRPRELENQLNDSGAAAVVVVENFAHVLAQVIDKTKVKHVITTRMGDLFRFPKRQIANFTVKYIKRMVPTWQISSAVSFRRAMALGGKQVWKAADVGPDDIAFLQYTGGTTGLPKGAMLTHRNLVANLQQGHAWLKDVLREGCEIIVTPLPLYHIFALTANCLTFFKIGATNILITNPRDIPGFVKELGRHRFTVITGVNTLYKALLGDPDFAQLDFSSLRVSLAGGMAVHRSVAERWKSITGKALVEAYGLTECSPAVTINPLDLADYNGSIGLPIPSTQIAIRDEAGNDLPVGKVGELCVRGPQVMKGYWQHPEETAAVMTPDGFLRTGDIAEVGDDGFVRIIDRKKDLIVVSGFKVFPNEIEDIVSLHPGVLEVGAVGLSDAISGEVVKIVVVRRDPNVTVEDLIAHCRKHLTGYKVPRYVEFRQELAKTNIGKVLRRSLRESERQVA